jgi:hypothetical protein
MKKKKTKKNCSIIGPHVKKQSFIFIFIFFHFDDDVSLGDDGDRSLLIGFFEHFVANTE